MDPCTVAEEAALEEGEEVLLLAEHGLAMAYSSSSLLLQHLGCLHIQAIDLA